MPKNKPAKKPSGPVLTPTLMKEITETAVQKGVEAYRKEIEKQREETKDRRFRNTKLLLEKYTGLVEHSKGAIHSASQVDDDIELEELVQIMKGYDERYVAEVPSIMESAAFTSTVVHHVNRMLDFWKRCCSVSQKPEDARRYRVIFYLYLAPPEEQKTFQQIADKEMVDISTIYKDHKMALRQLSALFFGYFE